MVEPSRRKEGMQRIRVGISGLVGVVLLIGLANIVVDNARHDDSAASVAANMTSAVDNDDTVAVAAPNKPKEPLAELGVAPAADDSDSAPVVADLQPDPNLRKPMDRAPAQH